MSEQQFSQEESNDEQDSNDNPAKRGLTRRQFVFGALGLAGVAVVGGAAYQGAEPLSRKMQELQGFPEVWSDEQHLAWFNDVVREFQAEPDVYTRYTLFARILDVRSAYPEESRWLDTVSQKRQQAKHLIPNQSKSLIDEDYIRALEAHQKRLTRTIELVGVERLSSFIHLGRSIAQPADRELALEYMLLDTYWLLSLCEEELSVDFARDLAVQIVRQQPDFLVVLRQAHAKAVNGGGSGYKIAGLLADEIATFESFLK